MAKPFDAKFVIRATVRHMMNSVDISIQKTLNRIHEFENDPKKSEEVFKALFHLQGLRKYLNTTLQTMEQENEH